MKKSKYLIAIFLIIYTGLYQELYAEQLSTNLPRIIMIKMNKLTVAPAGFLFCVLCSTIKPPGPDAKGKVNKGKIKWWTEIDVFEICGKGERGSIYPMNAHVFATPKEGKKHWRRWSKWIAPFRFADDYHIYALEWDKDVIKEKNYD